MKLVRLDSNADSATYQRVTLDRLLTSLGLGFLIYEMGEITMLHRIIDHFD